MLQGKVYLVGTGQGKLYLITLRGYQLIRRELDKKDIDKTICAIQKWLIGYWI